VLGVDEEVACGGSAFGGAVEGGVLVDDVGADADVYGAGDVVAVAGGEDGDFGVGEADRGVGLREAVEDLFEEGGLADGTA